ncbi:MAG TPA: hypothetical protein VIK47_05265, partial [Kiloniellales bacterium]
MGDGIFAVPRPPGEPADRPVLAGSDFSMTFDTLPAQSWAPHRSFAVPDRGRWGPAESHHAASCKHAQGAHGSAIARTRMALALRHGHGPLVLALAHEVTP